MILTRNASAPVRATAIALTIVAGALLFLFVASNLLLVGLRAHDGGVHVFTVVEVWHRHGGDADIARWLRLSLLGTGIVFALVGGALSWARPRPLHGRARWASEAEVRAAGLRAPDGLLLGRKGGRYLVFGGSEHVVVYAPTRSGKGVSLVIPNLLNWPGSVVVLDIKKENWTRTAGFRAAHGHEVFLFDPLEPEGRTARYNPLTYVRRNPVDLYDDLQRIASMLFPLEAREDPFWSRSARTAFIGIGGYIAETAGLPFTIGEVLRQLSATPDVKRHFQEMMEKRKESDQPLSERCVTALNDFLGTSDNTFASIRKSVTASLEIWLNPRVDLATAESDFDLRQLGRRPLSIYLGVTPDNLSRMAPLLNLFFQQVIDLHAREVPDGAASSIERDPRRQVLLLLDEFPALGNVAVLAKSVAFLAGYGIRLLTILQSPAQLRAIYGPDVTRAIMTNHAVEVVFRPKDQDVAEELSARFGTDTVQGRSRSRPWGWSHGRGGQSETLSDQRRPLMLPQELKLVPASQAFFLMAGVPPVLADRIVYHADRAFQSRLLPVPVVRPFGAGAGAAEVVDLRRQMRALTATVAELRATFTSRPLTDEEVLDPAAIPDGALLDVDFADIAIERENLTDEDLQAFAAGFIDRQLEGPLEEAPALA